MRSSIDDIIDLYKKDIDRTLIRENLKLTPEERLLRLQEAQRFLEEVRRNGDVAQAVSTSEEVTLRGNVFQPFQHKTLNRVAKQL